MLSSGKTSFCSDLKARVLLDSLVRAGFYMVPVILTYNLVILAQISTTGPTKFTRPDNNAEPEAYITKTSRDMFLFQDANFTKSLWFHPRNCTMHNYTQRDTRTCLHRHATQIGRSHFVFAGDSTMRIFHRAFISLVGDYKKPKPSTNSGANDKLNFTTKFYWIPLMLSGIQVLRDELGEHGKVYPTLMVYSCGLWHMKKTKTKEQIEYPSNFSAKFSKVLPYMTKLSRNAPFLWMKYDPIWDEYMTKWPSLVTKQVDTYHAVIEQKTAGKGIVIWRSSRKIIEMIGKPGYGEHDGIHLVRQPLLLKSQIIFNWHCNRFLDSKAGLCFADRPTTLEPPESSPDVAFPTTLVIIGFLTFFCVLIWSYRVHKSSQTDSGKEEEIQNIQSFFVSVVKLCIIMAYFYLCMRSPTVQKTWKTFSLLHFIAPLVLLLVIGIMFSQQASDNSWLNREQTTEWKGWMQLFLLLCNFTGADQALPLTFAVRAFVSSYLFLFAFGHFSYFWSTQSISIGRLFQIIFRLNLLTITLCLVTWKSYTTHFFVLLATGWFLIICVTMATCARMIQLQLGGNRSYTAVYIKLVLWFVVITVACGFGILWKAGLAILPVSLTQPNGSVPEWIWRLQLDRYTVIGGLAFACTYHYIKQRSSMDYLKTENKHGRKLSIGVFLICVICLTVYGLSSLKCVGQLDCLDVYPFVSLIPVISFVVLRNQFTYFRSRYSPVFAWFGKMSLELYISQYHIWMADDGHSILVLVPGYPILNFILTTCLLVSVCVEMNKITNALAKVIRDLWTAVVS